jgi:hypothetical protein
VAALITLLGAVNGGDLLREALSGAGLEARAGPVDAGDLLDAQLRTGTPLDAYTWSALAGVSVIRLLPSATSGLNPSLARALSSSAHGLVLAMESIRARDRYLVGSFLSGRTIELSSSVEGIARGPLGAHLHDDGAAADILVGWLQQLLGGDIPGPPDLGSEADGALLAPPWPSPARDDEKPLCRIAIRHHRGGVRVHERPGLISTAELVELTEGDDGAALGLGAGEAVAWALATADGARAAGAAGSQMELAAALPAWALTAPTN